MRKTKLSLLFSLLVGTFAAACGDDDKACDPAANTGCDEGLVCEAVTGADPACFAPLVVKGRVFDLADDAAVEGARVVAINVNGAPVSSVSVSAMDGTYTLPIPTERADANGTPVGADVTLRADAAGYVTFPSGLRQALPIDTSVATQGEDEFVVMSALTDIGLIAQPAGAGTGSISGTAEVNEAHTGVLVVAETTSGAPSGYSGIADRDGDYAIYNLPAGNFVVKAYAPGYNYAPATTDVAGGQNVDVDLLLDPARPASSLSGSVNLVNPQMGEATSVILVVESTFNETLVRGEAPPGLRAPAPGTPPDITGAFTIAGIPEGRYVVLAAFENDFLVRDASSIGGTAILHQEIVAGQDVELTDSFKVTGSLDIISPGAAGPEAVTGTPTFTWADDSSEDRYELSVFDAYGNVIWEFTEPKHTGDDPAVTYGGPALVSGMYYQFRVLSIKDPAEEISRTEDLKGVFYIE